MTGYQCSSANIDHQGDIPIYNTHAPEVPIPDAKEPNEIRRLVPLPDTEDWGTGVTARGICLDVFLKIRTYPSLEYNLYVFLIIKQLGIFSLKLIYDHKCGSIESNH